MQIPKSYDEMYEIACALIKSELAGSGIGSYLYDEPYDPDARGNLEVLDPDGNRMTIEIRFTIRPSNGISE